MKFPPWHQRPDDFDPAQHREGVLDSQSFLRVADQFISLANQRNKKIESTELQMVMLYAAARYAAHVGKMLSKYRTMRNLSNTWLRNIRICFAKIWQILQCKQNGSLFCVWLFLLQLLVFFLLRVARYQTRLPATLPR